jgi:hypothetical protein
MMIFVNICSTWNIVDLKTRIEMCKTWNVVNGVSLFHLSYLVTLIAYLCSQSKLKYTNQVIYIWLVNNILFVLNRGWKRYTLQMMIFVNVCLTFSVDELKTRFETWITRNVVNCVSLFHLSYLITLTTYL